MDIERELKAVLQRQKPDAGFTERVMAAVQAADAERLAGHDRVVPIHAARPWAAWRAVAAATVLTAFLGGWAAYETAERRAEGEQAREEVLLALRITSEKLRTAQDHVRHISN